MCELGKEGSLIRSHMPSKDVEKFGSSCKNVKHLSPSEQLVPGDWACCWLPAFKLYVSCSLQVALVLSECGAGMW